MESLLRDLCKEEAEATAPEMAVSEGSLGMSIGAQPSNLGELNCELAGMPPAKADSNDKDPCVEKLEVRDMERKLASNGLSTIKTRVAETVQTKPIKTKLVKQKSDSRGSCASMQKNVGPAANTGTTAVRKSFTVEDAARTSRAQLFQSSRGSADTHLLLLARSNGRYRGKSDMAKASEVRTSSIGSLSRQGSVRKSHSNFTVPQPFALATDKRASLGGQPTSAGRVYGSSRSFNAQTPKEGIRKTNDDKEDPKQPESFTLELTKAQWRASANSFNFNSDVRAARRKEFNSKMEERLTAKEAEISEAHEKTKENIQAEIKRFRKSLMFKATPMPAFYQDTTPPKLEIKKIPPTRAKSPKLGRRTSSSASQADGVPKDPSHPTHTNNQNSKENCSQIKSLKSSAQPTSEKKRAVSLPKKPLKQVSGRNASSAKDACTAIYHELDESGTGDEGQEMTIPLNGDEPRIQNEVGEQAETFPLEGA